MNAWRQMPGTCSCEVGEFVERECDMERGMPVQCGSCKEHCGQGGSCVGSSPDDCLSCGAPLVKKDSRGTEVIPDLMRFLPSGAFLPVSAETNRPLGSCQLCPKSCGKGSFMAQPCSADSQELCRPCSTCPVRNAPAKALPPPRFLYQWLCTSVSAARCAVPCFWLQQWSSFLQASPRRETF
jgi:hypothetical protein